jgi:hypothetical protein
MKTSAFLSFILLTTASISQAAGMQTGFGRETLGPRMEQNLFMQCQAARAALANSLVSVALNRFELSAEKKIETNLVPKLKKVNNWAHSDSYYSQGTISLQGGTHCNIDITYDGNGALSGHRSLIGIEFLASCSDEEGHKFSIQQFEGADSGCTY